MSLFSTDSTSGNDFDIMAYAASGMEAQRGALDVAARNIALAQTATPGHPVKGFDPVFSVDPSSLSDNPFASMVKAAGGSDDGDDDDSSDDDDESGGAARAAGMSMGGGQGLVAMTGVKRSGMDDNAITQMVDMLNAQRAYEANSSVFDVGKSIAEKAVSLGQQ